MKRKLLCKEGILILVGLFYLLSMNKGLYARKLIEEKGFYVRRLQGIKLGDLILYPGFKVGGKYDDNVFLTSSDKESDFVTIITPALNLEVPLNQHYFEIDYSIDFLRYSDYPSQDANDHILGALLDLNFRDFKIDIKNNFHDTSQRATTEFIERIRHYQNDLKGRISFELTRINIDLGIQNIRYDYLKKAWSNEDRTENIYTFQMGYRFLPKTIFLTEYNYGEIKYDTALVNTESDYGEGMMGIKGKLTSKCEGTIKVGYHSRKYEESLDHPDFDTLVTKINLKERFDSKNILRLGFLRRAIESTYSPNIYYNMNKGWFEHLYKLNRKCSTKITGFYQLNLYPKETTEGSKTDKRQDSLANGGIAVKYDFLKWLSFEVGYQHQERNSNFDIFDYRDNITNFNLIAAY